MRKTHLSCCVSNRCGVLVRVGVRMDPMCLGEWEWGWIRHLWEGGNQNGSNMVGRSEDGSRSVKVRISWGDTKPLTNILIGLSSELRNRGSEAGGWRLGVGSFQGLCIPSTNSHFHTPKSTITPTYHVRSILIATLPNTSDPSSLPLSQAYRIHPHSHHHEHAGSVRYVAWKVSFSHSGGKANNLIQDRINGSENSAAGYTRFGECGNLPPMDSHKYQSPPRTNSLGDNIADYAGSILRLVTFPIKLIISSKVLQSPSSLGDNIPSYAGSISSVVTFPIKLTIPSNVSPSLEA